MEDADKLLDDAGLHNPHVHEFVRRWAAHTGAARIEVVSAADDGRLVQESLAAGEIVPAGEGLYYSRSFWKDTARSEERTFVATSNPADKGVYNNWVLSSEMKPKVEGLMKGASAGKTMYVVPYLMAPPGSPLESYAAGVELTDHRTVVLHMIRMARVGPSLLDNLKDPSSFVRGVHVTGDLDTLEHGTENDKRHFVTVADERLILHFGSSYGGNALLGKIAHGLRQASYDGKASRQFLAEQFIKGRELTIGVLDRGEGPFALPVIEIEVDPGRAFDYQGKYLGKGTREICPAKIPEEMARAAQQTALTAHTTLGCDGYTRTDVMAAEDGIYYLETNTLPGLTKASLVPQELKVIGLEFRRFLDEQIAIARRRVAPATPRHPAARTAR